ncbi:MAG: hypothetical protein ACTSSK_03030 [Candidatus Heimdallarchaeota archaeon]
MKKAINYRPNFLLILYCINIFIIFLTPFVYSYFDGENIASVSCIIEFKVGFLGNWLEHRIFTHISEGTFSGSAGEIGTYSNIIIPFIIIGLIFSLLGAAFLGAKKKSFELNKKQIERINLLKIIGSSFSILGGLFGILSLIYYSNFRLSIVQPYDDSGGFHISRTPNIEFAYGYIICLMIFIVFVINGLIMLILTIRSVYQSKKVNASDISKTIIKNDKVTFEYEGSIYEEKEEIT